MKFQKSKPSAIGMNPEERIVTILEYFESRDKTYQYWLNDHNQKDSQYEFIDLLFQQGLLCISGLNYIPMSEGTTKHTDIRNGQNNTKIIFVTKDGYSFLSSYRFNQRSLKLNYQMKILTIITIIVSIVALLFSIFALFKK